MVSVLAERSSIMLETTMLAMARRIEGREMPVASNELPLIESSFGYALACVAFNEPVLP